MNLARQADVGAEARLSRQTGLFQFGHRPGFARDYLDRPELASARLDHGAQGEAIARGIVGLHAGERAVVEARLGGLTFEEIATRAKSTADRAEKVFDVARKKLNATLELEPPQS